MKKVATKAAWILLIALAIQIAGTVQAGTASIRNLVCADWDTQYTIVHSLEEDDQALVDEDAAVIHRPAPPLEASAIPSPSRIQLFSAERAPSLIPDVPGPVPKSV